MVTKSLARDDRYSGAKFVISTFELRRFIKIEKSLSVESGRLYQFYVCYWKLRFVSSFELFQMDFYIILWLESHVRGCQCDQKESCCGDNDCWVTKYSGPRPQSSAHTANTGDASPLSGWAIIKEDSPVCKPPVNFASWGITPELLHKNMNFFPLNGAAKRVLITVIREVSKVIKLVVIPFDHHRPSLVLATGKVATGGGGPWHVPCSINQG